MGNKRILIWLLLFAVPVMGQQAAVRFVGKSSHNKIGTEEKFTVTYTVNSRGQSFRPPDNMEEHFMILVGPNQSIQSTMTNRGFESTLTVSYTLRPKQAGTFTLGPARVMVNGSPQLSNPVDIVVVEGRTQAADPNDPEELVKTLSWMKALLNRTTVYVGEPIGVNYKIYFKSGVEQPRIEDEPSFKGFLVENIDIGQVQQEREFIDNQQVITAVIKSFLLFPQQPGTYDAQRIKVTIPTTVQTQRRDSWFGNYTTRVNNNTFFTIPTITVKPLPVDNRPDDFSGGVGQFTLDVQVDRTTLDADQSLSVKLTLKGSGNIRLVDLPKLELPAVFESYDPKITQNIRVSDNNVTGTKTAEYLLIPRYSGEYEIPALSLSYFNPRTKKYQTLRSEPIAITVTGDRKKSDVADGLRPANKEQIGMLSRDIMFIKTADHRFLSDTKSLISKLWFWILFAGLLLLLPVIWLLRDLMFKRRLARSTRLRKAEREVIHMLQQAQKSNDKSLKIQLMHRAMETYFSARLQIDKSDFLRDNIQTASQRVFDESFTTEWLAVYDALETLQYGGPVSAVTEMISKVESTIKKAQQWI